MKMTTPMAVMVAVSNGEDKSSCVLEKMDGLVVFKSSLQRPKSVIFEGLVREFGYGVGGRRKKMMMMKKKKKRELRGMRGLDREWEVEK